MKMCTKNFSKAFCAATISFMICLRSFHTHCIFRCWNTTHFQCQTENDPPFNASFQPDFPSLFFFGYRKRSSNMMWFRRYEVKCLSFSRPNTWPKVKWICCQTDGSLSSSFSYAQVCWEVLRTLSKMPRVNVGKK